VYGEVANGTSVYGPRTLSADCKIPSVQISVTVWRPGLCTIVNVGRSTVTLKSHVLVLPQPSVATTWTLVVVPRANTLPDGGVDVTVMLVLQLSDASTVQVTIALVLHVSMTMLVGQVIVGGMVSTTCTRCVQARLVFWQQSIATYMREIT